MKLFRVISYQEWIDFKKDRRFRTAKNTLEAKQFFKSLDGVRSFMEDARAARLKPPYRILLITDINEIKMMAIQHDEQILDGHRAITVYQDQLQDLNDCINFIEDYVI